MTGQRYQRITAIAMAGAASLAIAGFTALGSIFDYPQILKEPTAQILRSYRESESSIRLWFLVLVVGAAMLAPIAILLRRIVSERLRPWIVGTGIAAATVQVVGLSRWLLLIPGISDDATQPALTSHAEQTFEGLHFWLGTVVGETIGYALTAAFTVLVSMGINRINVPSWVNYLGYGSAVLIATGVTIPLGLAGASLTNFVGYIAWCLWLIVMSVVLWRTQPVLNNQPKSSTSYQLQPNEPV